MGVILAALGQYGLARLGKNAQMSLEEKHNANMEAFNTIIKADELHRQTYGKSIFETDAGQAALARTGLPSDVQKNIVAQHTAFANVFGGTAGGKLSAAANQAVTGQGQEAEAAKQVVANVTGAQAALPPVAQQLTPGLAAPQAAATEQAAKEAQTRLATEQAGVAAATAKRIPEMTTAEVAHLGSGSRLQDVQATELVPAQAVQARGAGAVSTATANTLIPAQAANLYSAADLEKANAELARARTTQEVPANAQYLEKHGAYLQSQANFLPQHLAVMKEHESNIKQANDDAFFAKQQELAVQRQNAQTAEDKLAVDRLQANNIKEYHESQVRQMQVQVAFQAQKELMAMGETNVAKLRTIGQYLTGQIADLPPGFTLPAGGNRAMIDERKRLIGQIEGNTKQLAATVQHLGSKDFQGLGSSDQTQQRDVLLKSANNNIVETARANEGRAGGPYDALGGESPYNYVLGHTIVHDSKNGLVTAKQALATYGNLTDKNLTGVPEGIETLSKVAPTPTATTTAAPSRVDVTAGKAGGAKYPVAQVKQIVIDAARRNGVDPALALAVADHESAGLNPLAQNPRGQEYGAGLFGFIPSTAKGRGMTLEQRFDPTIAAEHGTKYLRELLDEHGDVVSALRAYGGANSPEGDSKYDQHVLARLGKYHAELMAVGKQHTLSSVDTKRFYRDFESHNTKATAAFKLHEEEKPAFVELRSRGMESGEAALAVLKARK